MSSKKRRQQKAAKRQRKLKQQRHQRRTTGQRTPGHIDIDSLTPGHIDSHIDSRVSAIFGDAAGLRQDGLLRQLLFFKEMSEVDPNKLPAPIPSHLKPEHIAPFLRGRSLAPEQDYLLDFEDYQSWYFDNLIFSTDPLSSLEPNVIHSFNVLPQQPLFTFPAKDKDKNLILTGASFIIKDETLHFLVGFTNIAHLLQGMKPGDYEEKPEDLQYFYATVPCPQGKIERYFKNVYFSEPVAPPPGSQAGKEEGENYFLGVVFIVAWLGNYFQDRETEIIQKKLRLRAADLCKPRKKKNRVRFREITTIRQKYVGSPEQEEQNQRREPEHQVPVRGFWREIKGIGKDAQDRRIVPGKTWITSHTRWNSKPPVVNERVILTKEIEVR